jgi:acyl transferase domain-containing protein/NAD(P)-dependent dehydrogenase (short-subunit alcohol dehydrogenase family)
VDVDVSQFISPTPIAIIGMGCMFPKARDLQSYWANILNRVDAITDVPPTHWRPEDYFDKDPKSPDRTYASRGGFLSPVDFPPLEFGITPKALEAVDTTQLLGLMVAREALEDAGYGPGRDFDRSRVSVILGVTGTLELVIPLGARLGHPIWRKALREAGVAETVANDVVQRIADSYVGWQEDSFPGLLGNVVAGRIANRLNLGGTNCVVDAACASSLSALHLATMELASGRCDMVLSGGLDTFNDIFMYMCFSKTPALSPTGNARPFDTKADGTILGEGLGVVVLKRLVDAERDGDRIYAVIKAIGSSSDGKGNAIYAPNPMGQGKALRQAYQLADVNPDTIELVEAHGTGTRAGDLAELTALTEVYSQESGVKCQASDVGAPNAQPLTRAPWCAIGSVKSQIGHTKAAAGAAGLIKAGLSLHHRVLPPTIKVDQPSELAIGGPFYVNAEKRPWLPKLEHPRRAAVSSFGFGGSNFHCVLEEYRSKKVKVEEWSDGNIQILAFSADTREKLADRLARWPTNVNWEVLRHEAVGLRADFNPAHRYRLLAVIVRNKTDLARLVANGQAMMQKQAASGEQPECLNQETESAWSTPDGLVFGSGQAKGKLAFVFPGQGSQYVGMFRDLACQFPQMHEALAEANAAWQEKNKSLDDEVFGSKSGYSTGNHLHSALASLLSDFIYPLSEFSEEAKALREEALRNTEVAQPALGAVSLGAVRILDHFGIRPEAVAGHSYGEFVALHAAGRFDSATLQSLSILRGRLMAGAANGDDLGGMIAVRAPLEVVQEILEEQNLDLTVANKNSPEQFVLSGATAEINRAATVLGRKDIGAKTLPVSAAFHSRFVAGVRQPLHSALEKTVWAHSRIPVFANTTGKEYPDDEHLARRLLADQLAQPVEFVTEIKNMYQAGVRTFLEVGPSNKLTGLISAILKDRDHHAIALDNSSGKQSGSYDLARVLAALAALGHQVDLARWDESGGKPPEAKPALTVPICGANYRKPKPEREAMSHAGGDLKRQGDLETRRLGDKETNRLESQSAKLQVVNKAGIAVKKSETNMIHPESKPQKQVTLGPSPVSDASMAQMLRNSQENLLALQRMSEQTAQLHRQFLEGQDKALMLFQTLLQQQQGLMSEDNKFSLPQQIIDESLQGRVPTPGIKAAPTAVPKAPVPNETPLPALSTSSIREEKSTVQREKTVDPSPIQGILLEVVAEKTGYPAEMLELEMELDSDLGIDSIKRVEIFSALQERLPQAPQIKSEHLGTLRTLRQVVDFLTKSPESFNAAPLTSPHAGGEKIKGHQFKSDELTTPHGPPIPQPFEQIQSLLLDVVGEKTGYPADMLELDMELDSDLGIDSIKRVEIFSAMQERLPEAPLVKSEHLGSLRTLRRVVEFLSNGESEEVTQTSQDRSQSSAAEKAESKAGAIGAAPDSNGYRNPESPSATVGHELRRMVLSVQPISNENARRPIAIPKGSEFWITDDASGLSDQLARLLTKGGFKARLLNVQELEKVAPPSHLEGLIVIAPGRETPDKFLKDAFGLLKIASAGLRSSGRSGGSLFVTVSRMDGAFGLENCTDPVSGGLAGFAKTAEKEWPEVHCKALDAAADWGNLDQVANAITEEMFLDGPVEVGLSPKQKVTLSITGSSIGNHRPAPLIGKNDVVLVTGGARGVTAEVAMALAQIVHPTLVLFGRSTESTAEPDWLIPLKEESEIKKAILAHSSGSLSPRELQEHYHRVTAQREIQKTLKRIQETGGMGLYRCLNIRDKAAIKEALADIRNRFGPIRGIVHGAGVLADRRIEDKTTDQFDQVYGTKVVGLRNLLEGIDKNELKFLALMSSSTARFGRAGQVDYAAANEVLNKLAQQFARHQRQCRVVSFNWGPWDGGMVTSQLKKLFAVEGVGLIPLKGGAEFLVREINQSSNSAVEVVVLAGMDPRTLGLNGDRSEHLISPESKVHLPIDHFGITPDHAASKLMTLAFERALSVEQYPFLTSHVIDGKAVLPLTMIMEWLAHGALHGNPGLLFHGLDNVRVFRGVILEEDQTCTIRVLAGLGIPDGPFTRVPMELHSVKAPGNGAHANGKTAESNPGQSPLPSHDSEVVHARADVILATRIPDPDFSPLELPVAPYLRKPAEIYAQFLFHGPHFQGIERVEGLSVHGIKGTVIGAPAPANWIQVPLRHAWLSDPLAVDAAIQLALVWAYDQQGMASLPCFVGAYRQFRRFHSRERIEVVIQIKELVTHRAKADINLMDLEGKVVARMENYEFVLDAHLNEAFRRNRLRRSESLSDDSESCGRQEKPLLFDS